MTLTEIFPTAPAGATCIVPMLRKTFTCFSSTWKTILKIYFMWSVMLFTLCSWGGEKNSSSGTKLEWSEGNLFHLVARGLKSLNWIYVGEPTIVCLSCSRAPAAAHTKTSGRYSMCYIWSRCCIGNQFNIAPLLKMVFLHTLTAKLQHSQGAALRLSDSGYCHRLPRLAQMEG